MLRKTYLSIPDPMPFDRTVVDYGIIPIHHFRWMMEVWTSGTELWLIMEKAGKNLKKIQISLYINGDFHIRFPLSKRFSWRLDLLQPGSYMLRYGKEQIYRFQIQP